MPTSVLVFDHLTRRAALLHAGSDVARKQLKQEVIRCLRASLPVHEDPISFTEPKAQMSEAEFLKRVEHCKEWIDSGDIYQIVLSVVFKGQSNVDCLLYTSPSPRD